MTTPRRRLCYHCRSNQANPRSNFCDACLGGGRGLWHPLTPREKTVSPLTRLLLLGAVASTVWMIFKAAEAVMTP